MSIIVNLIHGRQKVARLLENVFEEIGFDRISETRNVKHGSSIEERREELGVQSGTHEHQLQIRSSLEKVLQYNQQKIFVHSPLVYLIDKHVTDSFQLRVIHQPPEQNSRSAKQQPRIPSPLSLQTHLITHRLPEFLPSLRCNSLRDRHCGNPPWLGADDTAIGTAPCGNLRLENVLRQLGGLSATGLTRDDENLMLSHSGQQLLPLLVCRQRLAEAEHFLTLW
ncbi:hypothetical protein Mapa_014580 [Marchantia paleacea]|nr:hypothetical protein Mapa_014580 [Marchantia paleacea]